MTQPDLSIIIPAYNCADCIAESIQLLDDFYRAEGIDGETIVVDDGSSDGTALAVPQLPGVVVLRHKRNRGKGAALRTGMVHAEGKVRLFTDNEIPYSLELLNVARHYIGERGFHAVIGDRTMHGSTYVHAGFSRRAISAICSFLFRTMVIGGISDSQCGFKAFRGDVADLIFPLLTIDRFAVDIEILYILLKYRLDIKHIPVQLERQQPSSVRVWRDSFQALFDIPGIHFNWYSGKYDCEHLKNLNLNDLSSIDD